MTLKQNVKGALEACGMLNTARGVLGTARRLRDFCSRIVPANIRYGIAHRRYVSRLVAAYSASMARPIPESLAWDENVRQQDLARVKLRYDTDRAVLIRMLIGSLAGAAANTSADPIEVVATCTARLQRDSKTVSPGSASGETLKTIEAVLQAIAALCELGPETDKALLPEKLRQTLSSLPAGDKPAPALDRVALVRAFLDQVIEEGLVPRAYEYDYIDDIAAIVLGRYTAEGGPYLERGRAVLQALCAMTANTPLLDWALLPEKLCRVIGDKHGYVPRRGGLLTDARARIPDLGDEFASLRGRDNPQRFLEINREYSIRQRKIAGKWGQRGLSLLHGFERNHHLMLRTLVAMVRDRVVTPEDEVLVVGPRHYTEILFFRKHLGLPRTIGLDLFTSEKEGIVGGDMHAMPFTSGRFRLIYCCATLAYGYDLRKVLSEMTRVATRPGYLILSDGCDRIRGCDPFGRSDVVSTAALLGCFYQHRYSVLFRDEGRSLDFKGYRSSANVGLRIES
jgi:SAM-dependent methyltransferase